MSNVQDCFVLGVRKEGDFKAHAWVEKGGAALPPPLEGAYDRFLELAVRPSPFFRLEPVSGGI